MIYTEEVATDKTLQAYITISSHLINALENKQERTFEEAWPILSHRYYAAINDRDLAGLKYIHGILAAMVADV